MRILLLNGDRQDAFWRLAVDSLGLPVDQIASAWPDHAADVNGWGISTVPCVAEIEDGRAVYQAVTFADLQHYEANLAAAKAQANAGPAE